MNLGEGLKFHAEELILSELHFGETCEPFFHTFIFLFHLTTVEEAHRAGGLTGLRLVVRYHDDGASVFLVQLVEEFHHFGPHLRVEVTGRFVGQDDVGIAHDGTGDGYTLALTAGELCRHVLHAVAEAHSFEHCLRQGSAFGRGHLAIEQGKLHIVDDVE